MVLETINTFKSNTEFIDIPAEPLNHCVGGITIVGARILSTTNRFQVSTLALKLRWTWSKRICDT
jgi:hypothetical protein